MAIFVHGKVSLLSFIIGSSLLLFYLLRYFTDTLDAYIEQYEIVIVIIYSVFATVVIALLFEGYDFHVAIRGCCLGLLFSYGVLLSTSEFSFRLIGWYISALAVFHWSEFFATAITNPRNLTLDSYLLQHSRAYHAAVIISFVEFIVEWYCFPGLKVPGVFNVVGLLLVAGGETMRKLAMWTAAVNFNHYIRHVKEEGHVLVTDGVYAWCRHPAYVGWFYWSVGTQLMLMNPVCAVGYAYFSWRFFQQRIMEEEITLLNFFGEQYLDYQRRVGTGLPFIQGYRVEL